MHVLELTRERRANRRRRALYEAVWELPLQSREAMLTALEEEDLIVGAYADRRGGICPILAAHRRGARAVVGSFPRAWDGFARARRPRRATSREVQILRAVLEESLRPQSDAAADPRSLPAPAPAA
jgi:hypothetical protein